VRRRRYLGTGGDCLRVCNIEVVDVESQLDAARLLSRQRGKQGEVQILAVGPGVLPVRLLIACRSGMPIASR
jgi:hypothetical protein